MGKKLLIDATHAEETRVVVLDGTKVEDFDFETIHKRQLAGNIYLAKVTRVEPSLQAAFVDYGGNRHGFLAFAEIHPDYYQIPVADRKALLEEERALARDQDDDEPRARRGGNRRRSHREDEGATAETNAADASADPAREEQEGAAPAAAVAEDAGLAPRHVAAGMDIVDLDDNAEDDTAEAQPLGGTAASRRDEAEGSENGDDPEPYRAADHATELDEQIESVADEDISDEVRPPRRPRARRYKIQEVIKVRQIMLVQVVKEERGNKGAALTTYLSLAGRYCVLMPNTGRGGGISRKITNAADRKKLKEIASEMEVPEGAGLIIRTAGANRTKAEIKRDYEYLFRLWEQIRDLTLKSIAPAPIYEEGDLIKRSIRDLYNKDIDEVLVEGEAGFRAARDFMKMIMPSHARNVKLYSDAMPLFARHQVESYLAGMFNPTVQLKSGGYIVIGVTEALVAIDINSGKATRQGSIEETALQTNLEAADEIARQLRLRDLAGLIVIDFIDMEERKNNAAVEKRLKDALRHDRARIQVGRISGFGLLEMSRQRLRPGMLEATTQPCPHCHGTGLIRSDNSIALAILRALEEEGVRKRSKEVLLRAPVGVVNYLFNHKREHLAQIEARYGMAIRLEGDPALISPDYSLEKFKTATRQVRVSGPVVSLDSQTMSGVDEDLGIDEADEVDEIETPEADETERGDEAVKSSPAAAGDAGEGGRRKRRRRRRRRGGEGENGQATRDDASGSDEAGADAEEDEVAVAEETGELTTARAAAPETKDTAEDQPEVEAEAKPKRARRSRSRKADAQTDAQAAETPVAAVAAVAPAEGVEGGEAEPAPPPAKPRRSRRKTAVTPTETTVPEPQAAPEAALTEAPREPDESQPVPVEVPAEIAETPVPAGRPEPVGATTAADEVAADAEPEPKPEPESGPTTEAGTEPASTKPRRLGWWAKRG